MDHLKISRTYGELGAHTTHAKIKIRSSRPQFRIKRKQPEMVVNRQPARMIIDNSRAFAQRGSKSMLILADEFAKWANDICAEAIARISAEGTEVAKAGKNRGEVIRQILLDKITNNKTFINVQFAQGPDVKWEEGNIRIDWIIHEPEIEWDVKASVEIDVEPGTVEIYVRKYPSLKIEVEKKHKGQNHKINRKI